MVDGGFLGDCSACSPRTMFLLGERDSACSPGDVDLVGGGGLIWEIVTAGCVFVSLLVGGGGFLGECSACSPARIWCGGFGGGVARGLVLGGPGFLSLFIYHRYMYIYIYIIYICYIYIYIESFFGGGCGVFGASPEGWGGGGGLGDSACSPRNCLLLGGLWAVWGLWRIQPPTPFLRSTEQVKETPIRGEAAFPKPLPEKTRHRPKEYQAPQICKYLPNSSTI